MRSTIGHRNLGQFFVDPSILIIALFIDQSHLVGNVLDNNDDSEDEDDERLAANRLEK